MFLTSTLKRFSNRKRVFFTTPGHKQGKYIPLSMKKLIGLKPFKADLSEVVGLDNIRNPEGVLLKSQKWASGVYGSKQSFYLFNGTTSGLLSLMLATIKLNDKVLIARNAHTSIINALTLSGAMPVWIEQKWLKDWHIPAPVSLEDVKKQIEANPDIKSVWITSPTYEGVVTDIKPIAEYCKQKGILLIVDEAHGALWNFSDKLPEPAIKLGADASVQSLHKTATCLNQGAILHLGKESKISQNKIQEALNLVNSTSPSYLILASIESSINQLNSKKGKLHLNKLLENIEKLREEINKTSNISILSSSESIEIDITKLFVSLNSLSGESLDDCLFNKYNIEVEYSNKVAALALTGMGTTREDFEKFYKCLLRLSKKNFNENIEPFVEPYINPKVVISPKQAYSDEFESIALDKSIGRVSKETITPYPPGIPVLIAGEEIQKEHLSLLTDRSEISVVKL